jgi:hypothetical protein
MRFCPFCSAENPDEASHCNACARRLPVLSRRRTESTASRMATARSSTSAAGRSGGGDVSGGPATRPGHPAPFAGGRLSAAAVRRESIPPPIPGRSDGPPGAALSSPRGGYAVGAGAVRSAPRPTAEDGPPDGEQTTPDDEQTTADGEQTTADGEQTTPDGRAATELDVGSDTVDSADHLRIDTPRGQGRILTLPGPPPTRVTVGEELAGAFRRPKLDPIPEVPDTSFISCARYTVAFCRARWQRRHAIRALNQDIRVETASLDSVLGALGRQVRALKLNNRALSSENAAIDAAEDKRRRAERSSAELAQRAAEENTRHGEILAERETAEAEVVEALKRADDELAALEAQRRGMRDKRSSIERQQKAYLKTATARENKAVKAQEGDERVALRRAAEEMRRDAAALDPERQDLERRLSALERPVQHATSKVQALRNDLEAARRSLHDAREGHRQRLAEIEAEQGRRTRELALAEAEIQRRTVTVGTIVNLHRVERPELEQLYARVDTLRSAIGAQSTEIDRLTAEREAYDKPSFVRGVAVLGAGVVMLITLALAVAALL